MGTRAAMPFGILFFLAVPVVLWLHLRRRRPPVSVVPSLIPWLALLTDRPPLRHRIPPSVLMAMHVAVAGLIAAALSDPTSDATIADNAERIVIVDTSTSMAAADRWSQARARVVELASSARGPVTLLSGGPYPRMLVSRASDPAQLERALAAVQPGGTGADIAGALRLAEAVSIADRAVYVVTDGADEPPESGAEHVHWVLVGEPVANIAITHADARRQGGDTRLFARVANFGDEGREVDLALQLDGRPYDRRTIALDPDGSSETVWTIGAAASVAELRIEPSDDLPDDDVALVPLDPSLPAVQLVGSSDAVERALAVLPDSRSSTVGRGTYNTGADADVTVFVGDLPDTLPTGGVVAFAPANTALVRPGSERHVGVLDVPLDHPLVWGLDLLGTPVTGLTDPETPEWAEVVLTAGGHTAAFAGTYGLSRVVVFAFDPDGGGLPTRLAFLLMVARAISWAGRAPVTVVPAGSIVPFAPAPIAVQVPGGRIVDEWGSVEETGAGGLVRVTAVDAGDAPFAVFGVRSGDVRESELRRRGSFPTDDTPFGASAGRSRGPIWPWLAWLAVAVCFVELLWRARSRAVGRRVEGA